MQRECTVHGTSTRCSLLDGCRLEANLDKVRRVEHVRPEHARLDLRTIVWREAGIQNPHPLRIHDNLDAPVHGVFDEAGFANHTVSVTTTPMNRWHRDVGRDGTAV